jgi:hypothetical protein
MERIPKVRRQHICEAWNEFQRIVLPPNIGETQRTETRRAFYAGCCAMFNFITGSPSIVDKSEAEGAVVLSDINAEIQDYADRLKKGTA